jgi:hypothetical protein
MAVVLDTDDDLATGHQGDGVDHWFVFSRSDGSFRSEIWDGQQFSPYGSTATAEISGNVVTIRARVSELGVAPTIRFAVSTYTDTNGDSAPDKGFATFELELRPAIVGVSASFSPPRPRAGRRFSVSRVTAALADGRRVSVSASCKAAVGGVAIRGRACSWKLPRAGAGKRLRVVVTVALAGRARSRSYAFLVR